VGFSQLCRKLAVGTYTIVRGNADTIANSTAVEGDEDGMSGCRRCRCGNDERSGELHVDFAGFDT
jgi:hypothetical protein